MLHEQLSSNLAFEQGISNFSFSIYDAVHKSGNELISPYSISAALLLLMLGTDGTTKNQMMSSMFKGQYSNNVHQSYKIDHNELERRTQTGVTLSIANRLFGSKMFSFLNTYKSDALRYYGSKIELLDFQYHSEQARSDINEWISTKTRNHITNMIPSGVLLPSTVFVLANAIYFKGTWKTQFNPKSTMSRFFLSETNVPIQVNMMFGEFKTKAGESWEFNCKVLQLPYKGDKLSMIFILPNDMNGLSQLETQFNHATLQKLLSTLRRQQTIMHIPKFTIEANYNLKPILSRLGITEIFNTSGANLTKMVSPTVLPMPVFVSEANHKTFIEINEEGSEAAAVTTIDAGGFTGGHSYFEFVADHPFIFLIRDNETGTTLFIGRFTGP